MKTFVGLSVISRKVKFYLFFRTATTYYNRHLTGLGVKITIDFPIDPMAQEGVKLRVGRQKGNEKDYCNIS